MTIGTGPEQQLPVIQTTRGVSFNGGLVFCFSKGSVDYVRPVRKSKGVK